MIYHIVLLAFKESIQDHEIEEILKEMGNLTEIIPEIQSFTSGPNCSPEGLNRGFTHGFTMTFETREARDIYLQHPEHIRVAKERVLPALKDGVNSALAFDYEA